MSLGGKKGTKAQESKQDFLERTRKEREEREQARRRERAALSIQVSVMLFFVVHSAFHLNSARLSVTGICEREENLDRIARSKETRVG